MADQAEYEPEAGLDGGTWQHIGSDVLGDFRSFRVRRDLVRLPRSGDVVDYYVLDLDDWVNVVALTEDDDLIMVEQYRPGTGEVALEFPAGVIQPGEDACAAGVRELLEETGFQADRCRLLGAVGANPALQTNRLRIVLATGCRDHGRRHLDTGEDIRVRRVPVDQIPALIDAGQIRHALAITTWYYFRHHRPAH